MVTSSGRSTWQKSRRKKPTRKGIMFSKKNINKESDKKSKELVVMPDVAGLSERLAKVNKKYNITTCNSSPSQR